MLGLRRDGHPCRALRRTLCAAVAVIQLTSPVSGQEAVPVAPLKLVTALLNVLLAEKACKNITVDHDAFTRYLADHGIDATQLSRAGPNEVQVVETRHKLRRAFARHNKEACNSASVMFGPNGSTIPGLMNVR
jgi:hypothetical protein